MASDVTSALTFRILLPFSLIAGSTKHLLRAICYTSALFLLIQVASQMAFRFMPLDGAVWEVVLGDLGILRFSQVDAGNIVRLLGPDIWMLVTSLIIIRWSQKLVTPLVPESPSPFHSKEVEEETEEEREAGDEINLDIDDSNSDGSTSSEESVSEARTKGKMTEFLGKITAITAHLKTILDALVAIAGKVLVTLLLGLSGIIYPSLTSAVYFVTFLGICSWWSCHREVGTLAFSTMCVSLAIFTAGHIGSLYLYQLPYFQDLVPPEDIYARLLGMTAVIKTNRTESWKLHIHPELSWPEFANPLILLLSYYVLIMVLHQWNPNPRISKQEWIEEFTPDSSTDYNEVELNCILWPIASEDRVWSITHNSWLTFVLLIWSCIIWMARNRRRLALLSSPFLVIYANILILLNFFVALKVSQEELFPGVSTSILIDFDLKPYPQPCFHIGVKYMTERQSLARAKEEALQGATGDECGQDKQTNALMNLLGSFITGILVKYWIFLCGSMFFIVSFDGKVVVYKILYIVLFLACVALYQIHYGCWRRNLKYFWMAVVSYSMVVLIAVYGYQFKTISGFLIHTLGLSEEGLRDIGLEQFDTVELFAKIMLPAAFLLACILQLHYFNEDFLKITSLKSLPSKSLYKTDETQNSMNDLDTITVDEKQNQEENLQPEQKGPAEKETRGCDWMIDKLTTGFLKLLEIVNGTQVLLWRLLEIHIIKVVSTVIIWITLQEVSFMNCLFYIVWVFALPYSKLRLYASHICTLWACVMVICKMMYQLKFVKPLTYSSNCTEVRTLAKNRELQESSLLYISPIDPAYWFGGLRKCDAKVLPCLKNHLTILALTAVEATVYRHQKFYRHHNQLKQPLLGSIFDGVTRKHLDDGLLSSVKYFINYGFYKFGLEMCFVAVLNVTGQRMDFYSLVHICSLIYLLRLRRRKAIAEAWPRYCGFLASLMTFQYFLCVGIPPAFCKDYPWRSMRPAIHSNLIKWLYLPDFAKKPDALFLLYDFLLLLFASLQWQVFEDENKASVRMQVGDNVEISRDLLPEDLSQFTTIPNFIYCRSYLDMVKVLVFSYHLWFVLCLVFLAGTTRINILCAGYLVAFFYFMLHGRALLLRPVKIILHRWDYLITYTALVIAMKNLLSIGACAYLETLLSSHCWFVHSFSIYCTVGGYSLSVPDDEGCEPPEKDAGILWDAICFTFLLIQRRIFTSYYHLYVVADLKATEILASRGAEMFDLKLKKFLVLREEEEEKSKVFMMKQKFSEMGDDYASDDEESLGEEDEGEPVSGLVCQVASPPYSSSVQAGQRSSLSEAKDLVTASVGQMKKRVTRSIRKTPFPLLTAGDLLLKKVFYDHELEEADKFYRSLPQVAKLTLELYKLIESKSEMLCYFVIILNHTISASILTLVLPILCFLWAMLSVPRPPKRFWMAAIFYTEATVVVKYFSQFGFFPWTTKLYAGIHGEKPFSLPNIAGIEKKSGYVHYDLAQLLALFYHRSVLKIHWPIRQFFYNIIHPEFSPVCDVYAFMFLVEGINFLIIIFGYWAFGKYSAADFSETLSEDQVPETFLAMILIQFGSMVVDRAIYLRKNMYGKCVFQVVLVIGVHFWLFFILPEVTKRRFSANYVAQIWYLVKCIYFGLSAYQIKCGYPNRILGNFLTKNFNFINLFLFQGFRIVPFLLELRAVMDWIWTDTVLSLSSWICLEDLYASIFIMKCWRESEKKYPHLPGQRKKKIVKYGQGGVITLALVFLMWFPLVFMSLLKSVGGVTNQPLDVSIKISISGYETLFTMSSQQQNLVPFSQEAFDNLTAQYAFHPAAMQFISNYHAEDIIVAKIKSHASLLWNISPANRAAMITELSTATALYVTLLWTVQRTLPGLIPKALRTTAGTEAKIAHRLEVVHSEKPQDIDKLAFYRNITIQLQQLEANASSSGSGTTEWWVIQEWRPSCAKNQGCSRDLEIIIYNDKVSPQSLGFLAGYGIVGLYVSVVMVVAKFIREHFNGISRSIMYEELPNVDRILKLCTDIFLVREMGDHELEEQLFSKLIFLYRSPETMIKWTREAQSPPQQLVDQ
ncbi:piezo-type mechanosensitive ion channel component 2-like [Trichosurus vulpecula]|uniref:piezo-type mechanosensitive ion channel component 2-like n=1 Tax=Trichosurus vulpecula TaxID=9337 RepID=UPI00186B4B3D|nr:piezo-type mechanosensitive ion channel component 2-like [Trichosurus vulpecula]